MSLLAESHQRHKRFHAEIARKAALIAPKRDRSYSVPNAPFGVRKPISEIVTPAPQKSMLARDYMRDWYHCMWFFHLIEAEERPAVSLPIVEHIQATTAAFYGVARADLMSNCRKGKFIRPRHVAMYLCKHLTKRSLPQIGKRFGGRDHTTVLHAVNKIKDDLLNDEKLRADVAALTAMVQL